VDVLLTHVRQLLVHAAHCVRLLLESIMIPTVPDGHADFSIQVEL